jgi:hypothetical protein
MLKKDEAWISRSAQSGHGAEKVVRGGGRVFAGCPMGHNKGKDNVKKRAARRKKTERLALEKSKAAPAAK